MISENAPCSTVGVLWGLGKGAELPVWLCSQTPAKDPPPSAFFISGLILAPSSLTVGWRGPLPLVEFIFPIPMGAASGKSWGEAQCGSGCL